MTKFTFFIVAVLALSITSSSAYKKVELSSDDRGLFNQWISIFHIDSQARYRIEDVCAPEIHDCQEDDKCRISISCLSGCAKNDGFDVFGTSKCQTDCASPLARNTPY